MLEKLGRRLLRLLGTSPDSVDRLEAPPPTREQIRFDNLRATWNVISGWGVVTAVVLCVYGASWSAGKALRFASAALLLAAASACVGAILGFLFGIPRSLQGDRPAKEGVEPPPAGANAPVPPPQPPRVGLKVNTNLEQISDWLTKILVGVGLTQLQQVWPNLTGLARHVAPALNGSAPVALFTIVNFSVWGFLSSYLVTRLFLSSAFVLADEAAENAAREERTAFALTQKGAHEQAAVRYAAALEQLPAESSPDSRRRLSEGRVFNLLYQPEPEGFRQAIQEATRYINDPTNRPSGRMWMYLACAYGQQYRYLTQKGGSAQQLSETRKLALDAVRRALRQDPTLKTLIRSFWKPNDPARRNPQDNDLEVFYPDKEFAELLE